MLLLPVLVLVGFVGLSQQVLYKKTYENSFYLLQLDHHVHGDHPVGRGADPAETERLINLAKPDLIQIHAKGRPGWTTYPSKIGHVPPALARDVQAVYRNIARKNGYVYFIYYNIGRDGEIMKRKPEWNRVKANGQPYEEALCYHSGVAENYLWPMIDEMIENYQPDGFWFDGSAFTVSTCYCHKCRERFRNEYRMEAPANSREAGWANYKEMQRSIYREFVQRTEERIKKKAPACKVIVNTAYSLLMPEAPEHVDYLTHDFHNQVFALSAEAHWFDSHKKPFDIVTTIFLNHEKIYPKPKPQIEQEMAIIIANGGKYFGWDNPTRETGLVEERYKFQHDVIAPFLRQRQEWCLRTERIPDISLLNSATDHYTATLNQDRVFPRLDDRLHPSTETFNRLHLNYEMISEKRLKDGDVKSSVLVVNKPAALNKDEVEAIRRYVSQGGILLWTDSVYAPKEFEDLLGVSLGENSIAKALPLKLGKENTQVDFKGPKIRLQQAENLLHTSDALGENYALLTKNKFGKGLVYYVPFGIFTKERAITDKVASYILERILPQKNRQLNTNASDDVEIVLRIKENSRIVHLVNKAPGKREQLKIMWNMPYYRIGEIPPAAACRISVSVPAKPVSVKLIPQNTELKGWRYKAGRLEVEVPGFAIHQMVVIQQ